jgi:hypothetical protein
MMRPRGDRPETKGTTVGAVTLACAAAGALLIAAGAWLVWSWIIQPSRDWAHGRGRWVTARVVRAQAGLVLHGPPYWAQPPELVLRYELDGQPRVRTLSLERTLPSQYRAGQELAVFVPQTGWALPRTAAEPNFPAARFGTACLLLLLGLLAVAAGVVPIIRGH